MGIFLVAGFQYLHIFTYIYHPLPIYRELPLDTQAMEGKIWGKNIYSGQNLYAIPRQLSGQRAKIARCHYWLYLGLEQGHIQDIQGACLK